MSKEAGQGVLESAQACIRQTGISHLQLAKAVGVDAAVITMFLNENWPGGWEEAATKLNTWLASEAERNRREAAMPVMTPIIQSVLALADLVKEDGGIGVIQGDSGIGKTESLKAVALRHPRAITIQASTARARPKPMLEDIGARLGLSYCSRDTADTYRMVCERVKYRCDLIIVDEVHKYIGQSKCLHVLADMMKETGVPQLWAATGDLRRYLDKVVSYSDPFAQIRSRISHQVDLNQVRQVLHSVLDANAVRELAGRKFDLKIDADAVRRLVELAAMDDEGGVRLLENVLKHAKRAATAGKLDRVDTRIIGQCIDRSVTAGTRRRMAQRMTAGTHPTMPATQLSSAQPLARSKVG